MCVCVYQREREKHKLSPGLSHIIGWLLALRAGSVHPPRPHPPFPQKPERSHQGAFDSLHWSGLAIVIHDFILAFRGTLRE